MKKMNKDPVEKVATRYHGTSASTVQRPLMFETSLASIGTKESLHRDRGHKINQVKSGIDIRPLALTVDVNESSNDANNVTSTDKLTSLTDLVTTSMIVSELERMRSHQGHDTVLANGIKPVHRL